VEVLVRKAIGWVVLLNVAGGCAHVRTQTTPAPVRLISSRWATVQALAPGTEVGIALDDDEVRYGRIEEVADQALTLWERHGRAVIARDRVARLAIRRSLGTTHAPRAAAGAVTGTLIGAVAAAFLGAEENATGGGKWVALFLGTGLGAAIGSARAPSERFHDEVIYIRS
jgi:hypothetical protein